MNARACATIVELPEAEYASHDDATLGRVRELLTELTGESGPRYLLVDLSGVDFFAARFVGLLIWCWDRLRGNNRGLAICGLRPQCAKLARVLHLDSLLEIYTTQHAAIERIRLQIGLAESETRNVRIRIEESEVPWASPCVRREYFDEDGVPIYCEFVPRKAPNRWRFTHDRRTC